MARRRPTCSLADCKDVKFDLNTAFVTSNFLVTQQDKLAVSRGDIALGLIQIYKALGGGWEIRLPNCEPAPVPEILPRPEKKLQPIGARFLTLRAFSEA